MPEGEAHERLIRQAYSSIGLDMAGTAMIEAHGKNSPTTHNWQSTNNNSYFTRHRYKSGRSYRSWRNRELLGPRWYLYRSRKSCTCTTLEVPRSRAHARSHAHELTFMLQSKPNLGHSEGAAALTGVMKAVVSLENRTILPNIKFDNPNPRSMLPRFRLKRVIERY
jgi:3-oxoacyl-(acyl-carrier-protein) synthase